MNIGVIGGSGLYDLDGKKDTISLDTPFGKPSSDIVKIENNKNTVYFIPRHGKGHVLLPSEINYRANLFALKMLKVYRVISISAVGSLKEKIAPGNFVLPSQYIDFTKGIRKHTFFGHGIVAHAHFADPHCKTLQEHIYSHAQKCNIKTHFGGTYICIEGPQFSTRAESHLFRNFITAKEEINVVGMTALPEAKLARELGMCYQTVAMATDYDCWNDKKQDVSVESILKTLNDNISKSKTLIKSIVESDFPDCKSDCRNIMKKSIITKKEDWPKERLNELEIILA